MAVASLVATLGLELDDAQLGPTFVSENAGLDLDARQPVHLVDDLGAVDAQERLERDRVTLGRGQALDEQRLALLDPILLAACFDDCVHVTQSVEEDAADSGDFALAPERRRPPLRPRRRGLDCRPSAESVLAAPASPEPPAAFSSPASAPLGDASFGLARLGRRRDAGALPSDEDFCDRGDPDDAGFPAATPPPEVPGSASTSEATAAVRPSLVDPDQVLLTHVRAGADD